MSRYSRRVNALETALTDQGIEAQIAGMHDQIMAVCAEHGFEYSEAEAEVRSVMQRMAEIGPDAFYREFAAKLDVAVETVRDPEALLAWCDARYA